MATTTISQPVLERFQKLRDNWKAKTRHLSNVGQISLAFSYQNIIGMGPEAHLYPHLLILLPSPCTRG
ncbi:MAG: hypothetical protein WCK15_01495, partial [Pirellula sp.]